MGAAQILPQPIAFMALSLGWSGQPWQSRWADIAMSDIVAIIAAIPLAWATEMPIPAARKTARSKWASFRTDQRFIVERIAPNLRKYKP
ncbi:hypothetical protein J2Z31_005363 [Sinorhizobium kostiense]|uniref:Uncharacterized protein n=1 Tax=Sinorhizobium kostiense TaxID=76747 RepID=A0ABS4R7E3_9HYPH|nr:hypothetical protein [Sinorhizobium kostiense]MBP2238822.1 hypothetical protein [Sinorhizobium kostiense]